MLISQCMIMLRHYVNVYDYSTACKLTIYRQVAFRETEYPYEKLPFSGSDKGRTNYLGNMRYLDKMPANQ